MTGAINFTLFRPCLTDFRGYAVLLSHSAIHSAFGLDRKRDPVTLLEPVVRGRWFVRWYWAARSYCLRLRAHPMNRIRGVGAG